MQPTRPYPDQDKHSPFRECSWRRLGNDTGRPGFGQPLRPAESKIKMGYRRKSCFSKSISLTSTPQWYINDPRQYYTAPKW
ncbi:hypothetical protein BaRGS_00017777 [Batillaria attramentaria]|uniref:Uncharacterized protein n=1 Tax=Batillaria attramentaria TaxID=370345 RepID=A0ABD0KUR3_9CAEN